MTDKKPNKYEEFATRVIALTDPARVYRLQRKKDTGGIPYAPFNDRVFGSVIDIAICLFLFYKPMYYIASILFGEARAQQLYSLAGFSMTAEQQAALIQSPGYLQDYLLNCGMQAMILGALFVTCWSYSAATPGKLLLRMRIVDEKTGCRPSQRQLVTRFIGTIIGAIPLMLGMFWIAFDKKRQGWHDKMAGTVVIRVKHWRPTPPGVSEYPPSVLAEMEEQAEEEDDFDDDDEGQEETLDDATERQSDKPRDFSADADATLSDPQKNPPDSSA